MRRSGYKPLCQENRKTVEIVDYLWSDGHCNGCDCDFSQDIQSKFQPITLIKPAHKNAGPGAAAPGGFGRSPRFCRCCKAELKKDIFLPLLLKKCLGPYLNPDRVKNPVFLGFFTRSGCNLPTDGRIILMSWKMIRPSVGKLRCQWIKTPKRRGFYPLATKRLAGHFFKRRGKKMSL
jgi:hypothetical protein